MSLGRRRRDLRPGLFDCEGPMASGLPGDRCPEPRVTLAVSRVRWRRRMAGDGGVSGTSGILCSSGKSSASYLARASESRVEDLVAGATLRVLRRGASSFSRTTSGSCEESFDNRLHA
ncbi:hypothetical protein EYF80_038908 [Liparis tanakae]|uniref:Uncharacterized protein n=1 Tax=Liparis tanakae TaxID=230148 RepID=A0A4Z2GDT2_9TELE|nr:hypothetical protein EYF80_038908 [Liparis tanakae]